ncbi:hypothetical protein DWB61_14855 [Ancylomarina euxinus]|uniref:Uncharacterized protein n=1 Tax=Ancylomarina euxinus TaxID=2283627 RepID=A0A425XXP5_9BACT|nr:hypothetical protein [Ancylomarina euxinus]MCZ4695994.1 hypothetical protein [Ancylomarina euxinus]MUP13935.1 hypothetical protein [Ancylomarina euxinus]RRG19492.1 hypothetical protein DWB61_14855 [Ancylomarina euxinus]
MVLNYKTGRLPFNFIALGFMLFAVSIWRIVVLDWKGMLFFPIALLFLFLKSGLIIDTDSRRLKKYIGLFLIKKGEWENIELILYLEILRVIRSQRMNVLSIRRAETKDVYKLILVLPNKSIELMVGEKESIINTSKEISLSLQTTVLNRYI